MGHYRRKPVAIEAWQIGSDERQPFWLKNAALDETVVIVANSAARIKTSHGLVGAETGDWIIRGVDGELYPCADAVFKKIYEVMP